MRSRTDFASEWLLIILFVAGLDLMQRMHVPVINIPAFTGAHGMPSGISVVAGRHIDQRLLKIREILSGLLMAEGGWGAEKLESTARTILVPSGSCNFCL